MTEHVATVAQLLGVNVPQKVVRYWNTAHHAYTAFFLYNGDPRPVNKLRGTLRGWHEIHYGRSVANVVNDSFDVAWVPGDHLLRDCGTTRAEVLTALGVH